VGAGCAAAIVILPLPQSTEIKASEVLDKITDRTKTELTGIALATKTALDYFTSSTDDVEKNLVILTDYKIALCIIMDSHDHRDYHQAIAHVRTSLLKLHNMSCHTSKAWIPGHAGISYNEQADKLILQNMSYKVPHLPKASYLYLCVRKWFPDILRNCGSRGGTVQLQDTSLMN